MRCHTLILSLFAATAIASPTARAASPDAIWEHRPVQIIQSVDSRFPPGLVLQGITEGTVRAVLNVDADGKLVDSLVTAYSHVELAQELNDVLRQWRYRPAVVRGDPVNARFEASFTFKAEGAVVSTVSFEQMASMAYRAAGERLYSTVSRPGDIDRPLALVHLVQPRHPGKAPRTGETRGTVTVEFYIDAEGRVRMPAVVRMTDEAFGYAAIAAVQEWRFTPPTRNGRPTVVRATQEFVFPAMPST